MPSPNTVIFHQPDALNTALQIPVLRGNSHKYLPPNVTRPLQHEYPPMEGVVRVTLPTDYDDSVLAAVEMAEETFKPFLGKVPLIKSVDLTWVLNRPEQQSRLTYPKTTLGIACLVGSGSYIVTAHALIQPTRWHRRDKMTIPFEQGGVLLAAGVDGIDAEITRPGMHIFMGLNATDTKRTSVY